MKLTAKLKLKPTKEQHHMLLDIMERTNAACNYVSERAWEERRPGITLVMDANHYRISDKFGLSPYEANACIRKVKDAYILLQKRDPKYRDKGKPHLTFKQHGSISFRDSRIQYDLDVQEMGIAIDGVLQRIPFESDWRQIEQLQHQLGESGLALIEGVFYIFAMCDLEEPTEDDV